MPECPNLQILIIFLLCSKFFSKADLIEDQLKTIQDGINQLKKLTLAQAIKEVEEILEKNDLDDVEKNVSESKSKKLIKDYEVSKEDPEYFDYIIVGGGMCGTVVGNRLSEDPNFKILLLEEGCGNSPLSTVPGLSSYAALKNYSKTYKMMPQKKFGLGLKNNQVIISTGKGLGGSSNICNAHLSRGHKSNFFNLPNWCYDEVLPYFKKPEKCKINQNKKISGYHNYDGILHHSDASQSNLSEAFLQCAYECGDENIDVFSDYEFGVARVTSACNEGFRQTHKEVYFDPVSDRKNYHWLCGATVIEILIDKCKTAYGVKYIKDGKIHTALANSEIVLCAGVYENAKLLFFSGIGPKKDLEENDIKIIQDLPVGKCIKDNLAFEGLAFIVNDSAVPSKIEDIFTDGAIEEFLEGGNGPLGSSNGLEAFKVLKMNSHVPNMQFLLYNRFYTFDSGRGLAKTVGFSDETYHWMKELEGQKVCQIKPVLSANSCGRIKLVSNNFWDDLEISGNYFQEPCDKKDMVDGVLEILKLAECEAFRKFGICLWEKAYPKCRHKYNQKEYINCLVEHLTISNEAPMGSCRMGDENDPDAVVDQNLKVIGIKNLRCGGDSVIPGPILGNIHLTCTMVCERLADLIKAEAGSVPTKYCSAVPKILQSSELGKILQPPDFDSESKKSTKNHDQSAGSEFLKGFKNSAKSKHHG